MSARSAVDVCPRDAPLKKDEQLFYVSEKNSAAATA